MSSLLIFSRDPGPTNQLIAVVERLQTPVSEDEADGFVRLREAVGDLVGSLKIIARSPADILWRQAGFSPSMWLESDQASAARMLVNIGLLITGTSDMDEHGDKELWSAALQRGIESHVIMDHPANLKMRFTGRDGQFILPDWIYVEDSAFKARLSAIGVPGEKIRVTGELHHARMRRLASGRNPEQVASVRKLWGAGADKKAVLFVSECTREMAAHGRTSPYDEVDVLDRLIDDISLGRDFGFGRLPVESVLLVVRPHPRDSAGKWDYLKRRTGLLPQIAIDNSAAADLALAASDFVVGMNGSLLYEAVALSRPTISLVGHDISKGKTQSN